ncbi:hypothetical protein MCRO_0455 [Mycoplasma crocodyli MP145]|uniref:Uncharacterized protein n=2 Tax=Mycoplasma TaxID=2093 RepID=D5E5N9_MYCCM|nr:hypothetical protein MCRO_0455 [Mycoplasma crocodyli MP145]
MWYSKKFSINYNDINVLVSNPDDNKDKITNFWHTHALGNVLSEWANILVSDTFDSNYSETFSVNATNQLGKMIEYIKEKNIVFSTINNNISEYYKSLNKAYIKLKSDIDELTKNNSGKFPIETFLSYFIDKKDNSFLQTPYGKMNHSLVELHEIGKKL